MIALKLIVKKMIKIPQKGEYIRCKSYEMKKITAYNLCRF